MFPNPASCTRVHFRDLKGVEGATENARLELSAPNCRGGKYGTKQLWKAKTPAGLEVSLLLLTCYGSHNIIYQIICPNLQCCVCFYISCMYMYVCFY